MTVDQLAAWGCTPIADLVAQLVRAESVVKMAAEFGRLTLNDKTTVIADLANAAVLAKGDIAMSNHAGPLATECGDGRIGVLENVDFAEFRAVAPNNSAAPGTWIRPGTARTGGGFSLRRQKREEDAVINPQIALKSPQRTIRFDDGQIVVVSDGLVVGRHPAWRPNYRAIEVASQTVSRSHWELAVSGERTFVRDLNSADGTWLRYRSGDRMLLKPGMSVPLEPGTMVLFGDRWAVME